jgi:hypothetical protein
MHEANKVSHINQYRVRPAGFFTCIEYPEHVLPFWHFCLAKVIVGKFQTSGAEITASYTGLIRPVVVTAALIFRSSAASFAVAPSMYPTKQR